MNSALAALLLSLVSALGISIAVGMRERQEFTRAWANWLHRGFVFVFFSAITWPLFIGLLFLLGESAYWLEKEFQMPFFEWCCR
jgi:ABC-type arginine/histidine transport system permease subunit